MEAVRTSETSVDNHFTRQYNPEDSSEHHTRRRENLKSHNVFSYYNLNKHTFYSRQTQNQGLVIVRHSLKPALQLGTGARERGECSNNTHVRLTTRGEHNVSTHEHSLVGSLHRLLYHKHDLVPVNPTDLFHLFESCTFTKQLPHSPFQQSP
jgi:hypothetical protein